MFCSDRSAFYNSCDVLLLTQKIDYNFLSRSVHRFVFVFTLISLVDFAVAVVVVVVIGCKGHCQIGVILYV